MIGLDEIAKQDTGHEGIERGAFVGREEPWSWGVVLGKEVCAEVLWISGDAKVADHNLATVEEGCTIDPMVEAASGDLFDRHGRWQSGFDE